MPATHDFVPVSGATTMSSNAPFLSLEDILLYSGLANHWQDRSRGGHYSHDDGVMQAELAVPKCYS